MHRFAHVVPVSFALLATGCAQPGLQTSALPLTGGEASTANGWQTSASRAGASPRPEIATLVRQARDLRSAGKKSEALSLLDQSADAGTDPVLLKERGLLAVELGQIGRAKELLAKAQDSDGPDWHVNSALGAALSASGQQKEAQAEFAKALALSPENPAVLNNLALSYALDGKHDEAERLLRRASITTQSGPQSRQNLALILGLKGNIAEARKVTTAVLPPAAATANISYLESLKSKGTSLSQAEPQKSDPVHSVSFASAGGEPIMHLGVKPAD